MLPYPSTKKNNAQQEAKRNTPTRYLGPPRLLLCDSSYIQTHTYTRYTATSLAAAYRIGNNNAQEVRRNSPHHDTRYQVITTITQPLLRLHLRHDDAHSSNHPLTSRQPTTSDDILSCLIPRWIAAPPIWTTESRPQTRRCSFHPNYCAIMGADGGPTTAYVAGGSETWAGATG